MVIMFSAIMLNVVMLSVIMLNVVMLKVVELNVVIIIHTRSSMKLKGRALAAGRIALMVSMVVCRQNLKNFFYSSLMIS